MSPDTSQRIDTALLWALIVALIAVVSAWQYTSADDEDTPTGDEPSAVTVFEDSNGKVWIQVEHESAAEYFIRGEAILGFYDPPESSSSLRNEIILQGRSIYTSLDLQEFETLLRTMANVTEVGNIKLDE